MGAKLLVVPRCAACPFFEDIPVKTFGGILARVLMTDSQAGLCNLLPSGDFLPSADLRLGLPPGPGRSAEESRFAQARSRRVIYDKHTIPDDCSLRRDDWTITVGDN